MITLENEAEKLQLDDIPCRWDKKNLKFLERPPSGSCTLVALDSVVTA